MKKPLRNRRVLVIDDNEGILFAMRQALSMQGYDVHTAETFTSIHSIQQMSPDMIYLDISLVGQDGRKISQELKGHIKTKDIPIVILTAYPNADELTKEAGANCFLSKPFELQDLWDMTARFTAYRSG